MKSRPVSSGWNIPATWKYSQAVLVGPESCSEICNSLSV